MGIWNTVARHVKKRDEHTRKAILACSTASHGAGRSRKTESLRVIIGWDGKKKRKIRTRVRFVDYGKTVLNDIAMLEGHNVVHAVSFEFLPEILKKGQFLFWKNRRSLTLLFQTSPHGIRRTINDLTSLWFSPLNGRMMRILYLLCRIK